MATEEDVITTTKVNESVKDDSKQESTTLNEEEAVIPVADNTIYNVSKWYLDNKECFVPPICNKLMFGNQLKIMFVGGPNTRKDYHIDCGDEFFFQMRGNIQLIIYEKGIRKIININQGNIFLLPGCIPHSPQRSENNSLGLVIERTRYKKYNEMDAMRWYKEDKNSGQQTNDPLFERWFFCTNLGKDLVPIVEEFNASSEKKTGETTETSLSSNPPVEINVTDSVQDPFSIIEYIDKNKERLNREKLVTVLSSNQTTVNVMTGLFEYRCRFPMETWVYVLKGECEIKFEDKSRKNAKLIQDDCLIVSNQEQYIIIIKDSDSYVMTATMVPAQLNDR